MLDPALYARVRDCLISEIHFFGSGAPTSRLHLADGITASVAPATPDRSLFNSILADDHRALTGAYDELAEMYRAAGVRAFTVFTEPGDDASPKFLEARGHALDTRVVAMAAPMDEIEVDAPPDLDWSETRELDVIAWLNDRAYGFPPPAYGAALARWPEGSSWRGYLARLDGRPVSSVMTYESASGDCGVMGVASLPEARGRGIAGGLLARALAAARGRGATTTSLQASPMGKSVYAKMGYRDLGTIQMWEHRVPKA